MKIEFIKYKEVKMTLHTTSYGWRLTSTAVNPGSTKVATPTLPTRPLGAKLGSLLSGVRMAAVPKELQKKAPKGKEKQTN